MSEKPFSIDSKRGMGWGGTGAYIKCVIPIFQI